MAEPASDKHDVPLPDVTALVTEDDTPVDNFFQDKQAVLLSDALAASWPEGRPYLSAADVAIFASPHNPIVPDFLLSVGVAFPERAHDKDKRSYYMWLFGKPPEVVVEVVSNREGEEDTRKLAAYARIKVPYYAVYDPDRQLGSRLLRIFQLSGASYVEKVDRWFPELGLGLTLWEGVYDGMSATWLRWCREGGQLLPTGLERAEAESRRAEAESLRAEAESRRAEAEHQRAEEALARQRELEARLRQLGEEPS